MKILKKFIAILMALTLSIPMASAAHDNTLSSGEDEKETAKPKSVVAILPLNPLLDNTYIGRVMNEEAIAAAKAELARIEAEKKAEEERKRKEAEAKKEAERKAYIESQRYSYNVFSKTGLSAAEFNKLLAPYALAGNGQALYDMEQKYGVNGIFCMAVANTESSLGGYAPSRRSHNYWGIVGKKWSSDYEGIMGFGNYIKNSGYYTGKSIDSIAYTYCPPTAANWAATVKSFMRQFWSRV